MHKVLLSSAIFTKWQTFSEKPPLFFNQTYKRMPTGVYRNCHPAVWGPEENSLYRVCVCVHNKDKIFLLINLNRWIDLTHFDIYINPHYILLAWNYDFS